MNFQLCWNFIRCFWALHIVCTLFETGIKIRINIYSQSKIKLMRYILGSGVIITFRLINVLQSLATFWESGLWYKYASWNHFGQNTTYRLHAVFLTAFLFVSLLTPCMPHCTPKHHTDGQGDFQGLKNTVCFTLKWKCVFSKGSWWIIKTNHDKNKKKK